MPHLHKAHQIRKQGKKKGGGGSTREEELIIYRVLEILESSFLGSAMGEGGIKKARQGIMEGARRWRIEDTRGGEQMGEKAEEGRRGRGHQPHRAYPAVFLCIIFSRKCCKSKSR